MSTYQPGHDISAKQRTVDVITQENVSFKDLLLSTRVLSGLQKSRFDRPSPIQLKAIPYGRCGLDLIVQAKSGTGKTCVFTVIALEAISVEAPTLQVIILAPTREIAIQIEDVIKAVGRDIKGLKVAGFIGGRPVYEDKVNAKGCHIAVGSPGRIFQLIELDILKCQNVRIFILDEADKLLEENFQSQINSIYSMLPSNKQMIAASATYPDELAQFVARYMRDPTFVRLNPKDMALLGVNQYYFLIDDPPDKFHSVFECKVKAVVELLEHYSFQQALIFSNYHSHAKDLSDACNSVGLPATFISGNLEQERRLEAMKMLKDFKCKVLISTDLTSRGIDASNVDLVLNLDVPADWETYMHRTGRAGRFGSHGAVISVVTSGTENEQLLKIARVCGINLLLITCKNGKIEFGSAPRDLNELSSNVPAQDFSETKQKKKRNPITKNRAKADPSAGSNDLVKGRDVHEKGISYKFPETESQPQIPKIPSLPELMSKSRNEPQFSYAYHDLIENWSYFKKHGVFKELRRIGKENWDMSGTLQQKQAMESHSSGKSENVTEVKSSECNTKKIIQNEMSQPRQIEERTFGIERKPGNEIPPRYASPDATSLHSAAEGKYRHQLREASDGTQDCAAITKERARPESINESDTQKSKCHIKKQTFDNSGFREKSVTDNLHRYEKFFEQNGESNRQMRSQSYDGRETKGKPNSTRCGKKPVLRESKKKECNCAESEEEEACHESSFPKLLLPKYSSEYDDQHRMGMHEFVQLQRQCQAAWQNYYNFHQWMQWCNMYRPQWPWH